MVTLNEEPYKHLSVLPNALLALADWNTAFRPVVHILLYQPYKHLASTKSDMLLRARERTQNCITEVKFSKVALGSATWPAERFCCTLQDRRPRVSRVSETMPKHTFLTGTFKRVSRGVHVCECSNYGFGSTIMTFHLKLKRKKKKL